MKIYRVRKGKAIGLTKKAKEECIKWAIEQLSWTTLSDERKRNLATQWADEQESLAVYVYNHPLPTEIKFKAPIGEEE